MDVLHCGPACHDRTLTEVVLALGLRHDDLHADVFFTPEAVTVSDNLAAAG